MTSLRETYRGKRAMNKKLVLYAALPLTLVACSGDDGKPRSDASSDPVVTDPNDGGADAQGTGDPLDGSVDQDDAALDASSELDGALGDGAANEGDAAGD